MEGHGISYIHLLSVVIPSTLLAVLVMSFLITALFNSNCLTTRFIVSVWKKAWLNCAVKAS
jgi:anaerobic C4-dicarboxylate transporter DcuA